ncbi:MAG: PRD domain-containing protein [Lachnospiraceae bacterium]|nr:PRD domain-containing protein [Lachnospiraceae bacterium]
MAVVIHKILNNNVIVTEDANKNEIVIMGRGIAFGKKSGDIVEDNRIQKIFHLDRGEANSRFQEIIRDISPEVLQVSDEIVSEARIALDKNLNDLIYVNICDHINTAVLNYKKGIVVRNALLDEVKRFYPKEYGIGQMALKTVSVNLGVELPDDEAGFIAMHLINAQIEGNARVDKITELIQQILDIVRKHYRMEMDEDSVYYYRFITHLKFFAQRLFNNNAYQDSTDDELLLLIQTKYKNAYDCVDRIGRFIRKNYGYTLSNDEILHLTIHVEQIGKIKEKGGQ